MKTVSMSGSLRENVGKKDAKKNRASGKVPCVLYGGKDEVHFAVNEKDFGPVIFTPYAHIINLSIEGKEYQTILQDVQYHPVTDKILHVDFMEVLPGKQVIVSVPIRIEGVSEGVLRGGRLVKKFRKLKVRALPADLPDEIKVNISGLDINGTIKVGDIVLDKVTFLDAPAGLVVSVLPTRAVEAEVPGKK
jgi:large subunit ribosomal protein L25